MKRFVFRLQPVLDLRARTERQAQIALAEAQRQVAATEQEIASLTARRQETLALPPDAPFAARVAARNYADALTRQAMEAEQRRRRLVREAEARRAELASAAAERRAVEKLREHAWKQYQVEAERQEQLLLDEAGTARYEFARRQEHG